jgi:hypothetical protein
MKTTTGFALAGALSLGLAACGGSGAKTTSSSTNTIDAGTTSDASAPLSGLDANSTVDLSPAAADLAPPADLALVAADLAPALDLAAAVDLSPATDLAPAEVTYSFLLIQDTEPDACTTAGPGADIDAVELLNATGDRVLGVGLEGSAAFIPRDMAHGGPTCADADCPAGKCAYSAPYVAAAVVEGPKDGTVSPVKMDGGFISLNGGSVRIQIGDASGGGVARDLKKGDVIRVWELDHTYITADNACVCKPESFQVFAQTQAGQSVRLVPMALMPVNTRANSSDSAASVCPALSTLNGSGCGTTVFTVP